MTEKFDLIVIGAGAGGLTAAMFANGVGKKVAIIERAKLGGDCTWAGCMPSKALLNIAKHAHAARISSRYGIAVSTPTVDMKIVRQRIQSVIEEVYSAETPEVFEKRGIEVVLGEARFTDPFTIRVDERILTAKKFIVATGARAAVPPISGLDTVPFFTNENFFDNDRLPDHLLIMGAGPISMEMGQAYSRLGAKVTIIGQNIMPRDEPEAVDVLKRVFATEGITLREGTVTTVQNEKGTLCLTLNDGSDVQGDMLLVAVGRAPNVDTLDLDKAGVTCTKQGIHVNAHLQTNVPHIYAVGDVTDGPKFTHYSGFQAAVAGRNAIFPFAGNGHDPLLPWVTFTDPEVAHVGLTEAQARQQYGSTIKVFSMPLTEGDRTVADDDTEGFIKLVYRGSGDLLGATVVADRAGEMIFEFELAVKKKVSLRQLAQVLHAYPTYSDVSRRAISKLVVNELMNSPSGQLIKKITRLLP